MNFTGVLDFAVQGVAMGANTVQKVMTSYKIDKVLCSANHKFPYS